MTDFQAECHEISANQKTRYSLKHDGESLSFGKVLDLWKSSTEFRAWFTKVLADSPFDGYRWETPGLSTSTIEKPFEFVLVNSPGFCSRKTDEKTYASYFAHGDNDGIVSFANLSGDAVLVVPSPQTDADAYGHLAAFIRNAPQSQVDAFWRVVSETVQSKIGSSPVWLSTAGGGVAWLHARIDSRPKYYGHAPYKTV